MTVTTDGIEYEVAVRNLDVPGSPLLDPDMSVPLTAEIVNKLTAGPPVLDTLELRYTEDNVCYCLMIARK